MDKYLNRVLDDVLKKHLEVFGAVLIIGPKWCGKSTTAAHAAKRAIFLHDPRKRKQYLNMIELDPYLVLSGEKPLLLDEWQEAPLLWDAIRHDVDQSREKGQYILTGSKNIKASDVYHSGAGRISRLTMRTLSLYESLDSNGTISLSNLFNKGAFVNSKSSLTIKDIASIIVRGGFPENIGKDQDKYIILLESYLDVISREEINTVDGVKRDSDTMRQVMRSLARHSATSASDSKIIKDIEDNNFQIHRNTLASYVNVLKDLFIIENLKAWSPKLRSKDVTRSSDVRHFVDPSLAARALSVSGQDLLQDVNTFGLLFETLVIRDLRVYTDLLGGNIFHYRDSSGLEADAIIHLHDGRYALVEVKLGENNLDQAAQNLLTLQEKILSNNKPTFMMIVTGGEFAYRRPDGVYVVPLGTLKP